MSWMAFGMGGVLLFFVYVVGNLIGYWQGMRDAHGSFKKVIDDHRAELRKVTRR